MKLRPYQTQAIEEIRASIMEGKKKPVLVMPTGSGKTRTATEIVRLSVDKGKRVLFLAPRRELIYQAEGAFVTAGIDAGIIMAGESPRLYAKVQIASSDTLHARGIRTERIMMPTADLVIVDEAHLSIAKGKTEILNHYADKVIIGLTATPARGDGKGLGAIYDNIVQVTSVSKLTEDAYLVPVRYFAPSELDLSGVKQTKSDYREKDLGDFMDKPSLIGDIVDNWRKIAPDKKTVVFCTNRAHSRHVCEEFLRIGIRAEHLDGETEVEERKQILARVASGETQVLCNVYVATYGLDIPSLECAVLARPTKNITLYLQTCGRVLRICEGKTEAIIIDHAGAIKQHGFVDEDIPWTLEDKDIRELKEQAKKEKKEPKEITCQSCQTVFKARRDCPNCGAEMIPPSKDIPYHEADLEEVGKTRSKQNKDMTAEEKRIFYGGLKSYGIARGYGKGWSANQYREKFGVWPNKYKDAPPVDPTVEVMGWVRYQQIKYAKSLQGRKA